MTILGVCQNALDYVGLAKPTTVIGQETVDARRLRAAVRLTLRDLRAHRFPDLLRAGSVTTVASTDLYDEPSDLLAYADDTFWTSTQRFAAGPINPQLFQRLEQNGTVTVDPIHRLIQTDDASNFRRRFEIYPVPSDVYTINFLYYSNQALKDAAGTTRLKEWTADDDEGIIDEDIIEMGVIWRMMRSLRRDYGEELADYTRFRDQRIADGRVGRVLDIRHSRRHPIAHTPEVGFGV